MPYYNKDPKRDHNFDNYAYEGVPKIRRGFCSEGIVLGDLYVTAVLFFSWGCASEPTASPAVTHNYPKDQ